MRAAASCRIRGLRADSRTLFAPESMDLPDLLEPERIRCRCDIHSKKRALQTVAELLAAALRTSADTPGAGAEAKGESGAREGGSRLGGRMLGRRDKEGRPGKTGAASPESETADVSDMDILDALISRERLGSTGLGHGVALPHSRLDVVDAPLAAMITLNEGVDFESIDGEPVDLVLGLLVPRDCNDEHLKILATLARRFNDEALREALRGHETGEELFAHLQRLAAA